MKTVVHIVQHLRPGGIECLVLEMLKHNQGDDAGDQVFVVSLEGDKQAMIGHWPRLKSFQDRVYCLNKNPGLSVNVSLELASLLKTLGAEVVHTHHIGPLLYGGFAARIAGLKYHIHTEHDAWHLANRKRRWIEKALLALFKPHLIADANLVAEQLHKAQLNYPVKTIHNGVDAEHFSGGDSLLARYRLGIDKWLISHGYNVKNTRLIGSAGRLVEVKGHQYLLQAMQHLPANTVLVLAGEGEQLNNILHSANTMGLQNRILLLGAISDMRSFYQAIDVFALSSLNEGLPLAPMEAQACNVPVVLTDVGACREACCRDTGILVPSKSGTALAWGIRKQLKQLAQSRREDFSPRGFIENNRSLANMVSQYRALLAD